MSFLRRKSSQGQSDRDGFIWGQIWDRAAFWRSPGCSAEAGGVPVEEQKGHVLLPLTSHSLGDSKLTKRVPKLLQK